MVEYIEREAALEAVWQILNGMGYSEKHNDRLVEEVDAILDDIPAADVRPVVLCRDCVHFQPFRPHNGFCEIDDMLWDNDFFCANGKRREDKK